MRITDSTDQKIAHDTGDGWIFQFRNADGEYYPEEGFACPDDWPNAVGPDFLIAKGFEIV